MAKCLYPVSVQDKDSGGVMQVPCGRCINCRLNRASEWSNRIQLEARLHKDVYFCTLTYNEKNLPKNGTLVKKDLQDFFKRLRREVEPLKFRYYSVGEYGEQYHRPHYHFILFGIPFTLLRQSIQKTWLFGFFRVDNFGNGAAQYVSRYVTKKLTGDKSKLYKDKGIIPEFSLMSRRPGIGYGWLEQKKDLIKKEKCIKIRNKVVPIPRYFYNKLDFSEDEIKQSCEDNAKRKKEQIIGYINQCGNNDYIDPQINIIEIITSSVGSGKVDIKKLYEFGKEVARQQSLNIEKKMELKKGKL